MTFLEATDRLMALGVSLPEIATAVDRGVQSVRQARMDPASDGYRKPPPGWAPLLADLARSRGAALEALALEIAGGG